MTTTCPGCYRRPPYLPALEAMTPEAAPRSAFPLLSFAFVAYEDDPEHGTLYIELAANLDAGFDDPGTEYLFGGVHRGAFRYREIVELAPGVRLVDLDADDQPGRSGCIHHVTAS